MSVSTLTAYDIAKRARERLTDSPEAKVGLTVPRLQANVDSALERLARIVAAGDECRLLMKDFAPIAPVAGLLDLTQAAYAGLLLDTLPKRGQVRLSAGVIPILWAPPRRNAALATTQNDVIHCWLEGRSLRFKNTDGLLNTFVGPVVINGSFIPVLTVDFPAELVSMLVDTVVVVTTERGGQVAA